MNVFKATLDTRHQNGVIGTITQFDNAVLELQIVADGQVGDAWESPQFELIAMKRDLNPVCEVDQDRFTILSKEDHKVQIELKEQFLACRGTVKMQLVIKEGSRLSTTLFYLVIGQSLDHDIVASYRDAKVLDDLDSLNQQAYDDLAFREQRYEEMEDSFTELNGKMNANEAERNKAEITRQKTFDINEAHRTRTFNNQVEEQGAAFSNAQTQREKDFSESQQNMSQAFETSQRERESAFNKAQELNQTTFTNNETKRQTAFNQSQTANQQDFVDNEAERQRLFETNESSRQKSESQRVKNESERVFAETQRADAEVIRQQKMTEFEEKATQLSEDLDNQVARVDEFVTANEEKLLGPHDKTDYMGNAHKSVKDVNDANVEYILGEVNTVHYEGQHITATDTIEKQVRSAILKGQTLVNLSEINKFSISGAGTVLTTSKARIKDNTTYTRIVYITNNTLTGVNERNNVTQLMSGNLTIFNNDIQIPLNATGLMCHETFNSRDTSTKTYTSAIRIFDVNTGGILEGYEMIIEGDYTNIDIPYFTGMQSVKMPVLKACGKNLLNEQEFSKGGWIAPVYENGKLTFASQIGNRGSAFFKCFLEKGKTYVASFQNVVGDDIMLPNFNISTLDDMNNVHFHFINERAKTFELETGYYYLRPYSVNDMAGTVSLNIQLEEHTQTTTYEPFKSNILTVNEDVTLRGIGDVQDTLDCLTGEVTENIVEYSFNGDNYRSIVGDLSNNDTYAGTKEKTTIFRFQDYNTQKAIKRGKIISNLFSYNAELWGLDVEGICCIENSVDIRILKSRLNGYNDDLDANAKIELFKTWLNNVGGITVQCEPYSKDVIKTVDLNDQKVYSYDGTTHYSCSAAEGSLIPTLAIDVPTNLPALVSRQRVTIESQKEQIITLEEENEQLIAQNEVQDIDISLNQDAINFMLFAPATMSVNNKSRNNEGVNTMAAYLANQILKGKLDYTLVVSRYGSYKEDIDTILIAEGKQDLIK